MKVHNLSNLPVIDYRGVKPLQGNLKDLSDVNHDKLLRVLEHRGFTTPLFLWYNPDETAEGWYLLDGHQRHRVMMKNNLSDNGKYLVPYVQIPAATVQEAKEQLLEIASQYGRITQEGLDEFGFDLDLGSLNISFDALPDFSMALPEPDPEVEEDEAPPVDDANPAVSRLGEVYQLGRHRLMCGDSTDAAAVSLLLAGAVPHLMITDPPYGVNYDPAWREGVDLGVGERSKGKVVNDNIVDWSTAYSLFPGSVAYVFHAGVYTGEVGRNLQDCGYNLISQIIWVKQHFALSRGDYHWQHEPLWYAVKKGENHHWQGARDQATTWEIKNNNSFGNSNAEETWGHGTQKPVECMARPVRNNSAIGESIYDPFGGSGSALIACEQLDRTCYMMELDPKYCDVIRKRYHKLVAGSDEGWQAATPAISSVPDHSPTPVP